VNPGATALTDSTSTDPLVEALLGARLHDPFRFLGLHRTGSGWTLRVFNPHAEAVWMHLHGTSEPLERVHPAGLFEWRGTTRPPEAYLLGVLEDGRARSLYDPYAFVPALSGHARRGVPWAATSRSATVWPERASRCGRRTPSA
jgi:1,4-alpha-glucan branching enzyme